MTADEPAAHPAIAPLSFLLGRWEGAGIGGYPTIESFRFGQEITFSHIGKPYLIYASRSWRLDDDGNKLEPLAMTPDGPSYEFANEVTGGRVPREFIPSVDAGAQEAMQYGVLAG